MMELTFKTDDLINLCTQTITKIDNYISSNSKSSFDIKERLLHLKTLKQALSYSVSTTVSMDFESYYSLFNLNQDYAYALLNN